MGLGLIGVLWIGMHEFIVCSRPFIDINHAALGVFLAVSESADADVECFAEEAIDEDPIDMPGCE